jgi:hypothetical protein
MTYRTDTLAGDTRRHPPRGEKPVSARKPTADGKKATTVVANDPDDLKGTLKQIGGSQSDNWNNVLANQTFQTLWLKNSDKETSDRQVSATAAGLVGIGPKDELEGMIAAQLLAAPMECYRRAMIGEQTFEPQAIAYAPGIEMPSPNPEWSTMPSASDAERPLPDARRNVAGRSKG